MACFSLFAYQAILLACSRALLVQHPHVVSARGLMGTLARLTAALLRAASSGLEYQQPCLSVRTAQRIRCGLLAEMMIPSHIGLSASVSSVGRIITDPSTPSPSRKCRRPKR